MESRFAGVDLGRKFSYSEKEAKILQNLGMAECLGRSPISSILKEAAVVSFIENKSGAEVDALRDYLKENY